MPGKKTTANIMLVILGAICIFHLLVLFGAVPYTLVWGGRLTGFAGMVVYESVSLAISLAVMLVVMAKAGYVGILRLGVIRVSIWVVLTVFALSTLGNLVSESNLEKMIFTPVAMLLAVLSLRLALIK